MTLWRVLVGVGALLAAVPLLLGAMVLPFFVGWIVLATLAYHATDMLRLRTASLDRALLAHELADLLDLGVPLDEAVQQLDRDLKGSWRTGFTSVTRAWTAAAAAVQKGSSLAQGLAGRSAFPRLWANALAAGQAAERLPAALRRLAQLELMEVERRRHSQIPRVLLALVCLGIVFFLTTYIWPTFVTLYEGMAAELPQPLRFLVTCVKALRNPAVIVPLAVVAAGAFAASRGVRPLSASSRLGEQARLAEALACGADLGLSVPQMLDLASLACGPSYRKVLRELATSVGDSLSQALARKDLLPPAWLWLVRQGEARGELTETLHLAAGQLLEEQHRVSYRQAMLISQGALVTIGCFVGLVCVATMGSITQLTQLLTEAW